MGGLLTSKQTQTQRVDPRLEAESASLIGLLRLMMSQETPINRGVTIAGFTPTQEAAFNNQRNAAAAFGMAAPSSTGLPATEASATGVQGYRTAPEVDASKAMLPPEYVAMMEQFRKQAGTETPKKGFKSGG